MAIYALPETRTALGDHLLRACESRSLFKDRFADPEAAENTRPTREEWFRALIARRAESRPHQAWLPASATRIHARLMSRLVVDLAGGVMENANVSLDRYGLPVIPGSAVKGCARRMALQALHDWIVAGTDRPDAEDACGACCEGFETPATMLSAIARIFGWIGEDWQTGKKADLYKSDFAWAVMGREEALQTARTHALQASHEGFAGSIAFLAATPNCDPGLELDVVTPHHTKYYQREPGYEDTAADTEDPIPIYFPVVRAQGDDGYFTFPLIPLQRGNGEDLSHAQRWLSQGLDLVGIGAKTNAGYGWFRVVEDSSALSSENSPATTQTSRASDYASQAEFENRVLKRLTRAEEYQVLKREVEHLGKEENGSFLEQLKNLLASPAGKDARKKLKKKDWFPKDWLPQ